MARSLWCGLASALRGATLAMACKPPDWPWQRDRPEPFDGKNFITTYLILEHWPRRTYLYTSLANVGLEYPQQERYFQFIPVFERLTREVFF